MNFIISILSKLPAIVLVSLAAVSVIIGDFFAKYWSLNQKNIFYILTLIFYLGSGVLYVPSLLKEGLVITSIIWVLISTIGLLLVGIVIFKEQLSFIQVIGVTLGIIALLILIFGE